jgi:hypothetical protein
LALRLAPEQAASSFRLVSLAETVALERTLARSIYQLLETWFEQAADTLVPTFLPVRKRQG